MKYLRILLLVVVVVECVLIVRKGFFEPLAPPLPQSNLSALEAPVAAAIRKAEESVNRRSSDNWIELGDIYRSFGLLPEAVYCYQQVEKLNSQETSHLYYWALCHSRMGNLEEAEKIFQRSVDADPSRLTAQFALVRIGQDRLRRGDAKGATEFLRKAVQVGGSRIWLCRLLIREGSVAEAIALLNITISQFPRSIRAHQLLAWAHEKQGEHEKARRHYEMVARCTTEVPSDEPVRQEDERLLGQFGSPALQLNSYLLEQQNKLKEALDTSEKALQVAWKEDYALQNAFLLMKNDRPQEAVNVIKECIDRAGESAESLQLLGDAWEQAKDLTKAIAAWERATLLPASRRPAQDVQVRQKLVKAYRATGGDAKVVKKHEGFFHFSQGKLDFLKNDLVAAEQNLEQASRLIAAEPIVWFYLAETYRFNKKFDKSAVAYGECLKLDPNFGRAIRGQASLAKDRKKTE